MTYQGERARPMADESGRCFEVSKVRLDASGRVVEVVWGEAPIGSDVSPRAWVLAPVAEVVDALHDGARVAAVFGTSMAGPASRRPERPFVVIEHADGGEGIALDEATSPGRELRDLVGIDS